MGAIRTEKDVRQLDIVHIHVEGRNSKIESVGRHHKKRDGTDGGEGVEVHTIKAAEKCRRLS